MKSIMLSVRPEWVQKILNGEKTIEIRKTMPKYELPIKVYIYCTKGGVKLAMKTPQTSFDDIKTDILNGKVVAEFTLKEVEKSDWRRKFIKHEQALKKACLTQQQLTKYLEYVYYGYAWHISDLKIYDNPKELSDFGIIKEAKDEINK